MLRKPNIIQRMFINNFFHCYKHGIAEAEKLEVYAIVGLYNHRIYLTAPIDDVDYWITQIQYKGYKWVVLNNIVFIWGKGVRI